MRRLPLLSGEDKRLSMVKAAGVRGSSTQIDVNRCREGIQR